MEKDTITVKDLEEAFLLVKDKNLPVTVEYSRTCCNQNPCYCNNEKENLIDCVLNRGNHIVIKAERFADWEHYNYEKSKISKKTGKVKSKW